jgi:hypothetical protein
MLMKLLVAAGLVVVTVAIHAVGLSALLRTMMPSQALATAGFRPVTGLVMGVTCWLVVIHLADSGVTYTTLGYGDHLLPKPWRMLAPLEALTGILMCGLSIGLFFTVVSRFISKWVQARVASEPHAAAPTDR